MIPKIIHQIWIGEKLPPQDYMNTWKMEGFEYVLWDEEKINKLNLVNRDKYEYFLNKKIYYGAADIVRIEILYQHGGMYVDADTTRLKNLPLKWFDYNFFAVEANTEPRLEYRIANGVMAAEPKNTIIEEYIERIKTAKKIEPCSVTIGGTMLTNIIVQHYKEDPMVLVLEPYTFYPINSRKFVHNKADQAYARHEWGSINKKLYRNKGEIRP